MLFRAIGPLLCGGLMLLAGAASARDGDPLPGIDVSMEQHPTGIIIAQTTTNSVGLFVFRTVPQGTFVVRIKSGPNAGKILKTVTVTKPGPLSGKVVAKGAGAVAK